MTAYRDGLAAEAADVLAGCEARLEEAVKVVRSLDRERKEIIEARDAAREREGLAHDNWMMCRKSEGEPSRREKEAERETHAAYHDVSRADGYLASGELDAEYRKAVARQMAGLLREDARHRLKGIKARTNDPGLLKTVAECDDGVLRAARYVINMFPLASQLHSGEVNKARAEARDRLGFSD